LAEDLVIVEGEVEQLAVRLVHVPGAIDDELERVTLGITRVNRPRVSVVQRHEVGITLGGEAFAYPAQGGEILEPEGDLKDRAAEAAAENRPVLDGAFGAAGGEHELMVLAGVSGQKDELRVADGNVAAIGHRHAEDASIEVLHFFEIEAADA